MAVHSLSTWYGMVGWGRCMIIYEWDNIIYYSKQDEIR
jgi:hypothetical protein